jgi:hypothetical protein
MKGIYFGSDLESNSSLKPNGSLLPVEVEGERRNRLEYQLFWIVALVIIAVILAFAFL